MPKGMNAHALRGEGWAMAVVVGSRCRFHSIQKISRSELERCFVAVIQTSLAEIVPEFPVNEPPPQMQVRKRNGAWEPVDVNKIVRAVQRCCHGLSQVDPMRVASRTIGGLYDGATTRELDSI